MHVYWIVYSLAHLFSQIPKPTLEYWTKTWPCKPRVRLFSAKINPLIMSLFYVTLHYFWYKDSRPHYWRQLLEYWMGGFRKCQQFQLLKTFTSSSTLIRWISAFKSAQKRKQLNSTPSLKNAQRSREMSVDEKTLFMFAVVKLIRNRFYLRFPQKIFVLWTNILHNWRLFSIFNSND